jgi:hypothetical protein
MRVTALNADGSWKTGSEANVVSKGYAQVQFQVQVEDGEEYLVRNAAGDLEVNEKDDPEIKGVDVSITFVRVNPNLFELVAPVRALADYGGNPVGWELGRTLTPPPFALEVWTKVAGEADLWVYSLLPYINLGRIGDFTIEKGAASFTLSGARTKVNANWGVGPYDVVYVAADTAGKLLGSGVSVDADIFQMLTEVPPPAESPEFGTISA